MSRFVPGLSCIKDNCHLKVDCLPGKKMLHLPRVSDWCLGSSSGGSLSVTPLLEGPAIGAGKISLPLSRVNHQGDILETAVLNGFGASVSFSIAAEIPVNFSLSTPKAPGGGTFLLVGPTAPDAVPASFFEGLCIVYAADMIFGFMDKNSSVVVFLSTAAIAMPFPYVLGLVRRLGWWRALALLPLQLVPPPASRATSSVFATRRRRCLMTRHTCRTH